MSSAPAHAAVIARPPLVVVWRVTERCDTACAFCAFDVSLRRPRRAVDAAEVLRFGALVAAWARSRGRVALVSFLGGEPLLWPPLTDVCSRLRDEGAALAVTTNGRALAAPRWLRFAAGLHEVTVSIDGPPAVHDALRGVQGGGRSLLEALGALRALRRDGRPKLRVNTVLMRDNVARLPELARLVADAGADELTFNALGGRDRPEFYPAHALRPADVAALGDVLPELRAEATARGLTVTGAPGYLRRLRAWAAGEALPVEDCGPGRDFWFVEADGRLAPCSFALEAGVPIASLRAPEDLDALAARLAQQRAQVRPAACGDCPSTQQHGKWRG